MSKRLKFRFLTVIWGDKYIEEFARVSAPSYLAAGNLPFVARETDLEILIMTSKDSRQKFDEEPVFKRLSELCPVHYIFIDDLISTGVYGVTLTLAYARGIRASGANQINTHFIFMNSDFILADGSLATLVRKFKEGHLCIMAPSLRASSESTLRLLRDAVDKTNGTLTMAPREMVKLAFDNLHPTVVGKTITQNFITCTTHNQIYWQVDENTLLGRYHLIFMLAIKPEVPLPPVNSYCDYGFVPEMVPSGEFSVLSDSDEFFMLELQAEAQENFMLRCGSSSQRQIAQELSQWTTREHRRFAENDVVFHSNDLPARLADSRKRAAAFMVKIQLKMRRQAADHVDHYYWVSGVQHWALLKFGRGATNVQFPVELADVHRKRKFYFGFLPLLRRLVPLLRRLAGVMPNVPIWSYLWLDSRLIVVWAHSAKAHSSARNLLICDQTSPFPRSLQKIMPLDVLIDTNSTVAPPALTEPDKHNLTNLRGESDNQPYDNILIHVYRAHVLRTREKLDSAMKLAKPGGTVSIYIQHERGEFEGGNFSWELAQYVNEIFDVNWIGHRITARFVGGRTKRLLRRAEGRLAKYLIYPSLPRLPFFAAAVFLLPFVAIFTVANNLRQRNASDSCPDYCSSMLLSVTKAPTSRDNPAHIGE